MMSLRIKKIIVLFLVFMSYACTIIIASLFQQGVLSVNNENYNQFIFIAILSIGVITLEFIIQFGAARLKSIIIETSTIDMQTTLFRKLFDKTLSGIRRIGSRSIIQTISNDTYNLIAVKLERQLLIVRLMGSSAVCIFAFTLHPLLTLSTIFMFLTAIVIEKVFGSKLQYLAKRNMEADIEVKTFFKHYWTAIESIKTSVTSQTVDNHFNAAHKQQQILRGNTIKIQSIKQFILILHVSLIFVYFICLSYYFYNKGQITFAEIVAITVIMNRFMEPIGIIVALIEKKRDLLLYKSRINQFNNIEDKQYPHLSQQEHTLISDNFTFSYGDHGPSFNFPRLSIKKGTLIQLIGGNGVGKSTLLKALAGFEALSNNGINKVTVDICYVGKQSHFEACTIIENMQIVHEITENQLNDMAACLHLDFISTLKYGWQTVLDGQIFSVGQYQRLAILRALLSEPTLLILDEALTGISEAQEIAIMDTVKEIMREGYLIVVSHRVLLNANNSSCISLDGTEVLA